MMSETVTETELVILQFLWDKGELSSGNVTELLYNDLSDTKRASAQKLLERLVWKGCVAVDKSARPHKFRPALDRDEFARRQVQILANRLYNGAVCPVLTSLVQSDAISPPELEALRVLVNSLAPTHPPKNKAARRKG